MDQAEKKKDTASTGSTLKNDLFFKPANNLREMSSKALIYTSISSRYLINSAEYFLHYTIKQRDPKASGHQTY